MIQLLLAAFLTPAAAADKIVDYGADDRPCAESADASVHASVDELQCVTGWLERNADFGRSKDAAKRKFYETQRKRAKTLVRKVDRWVGSAEDRSTPVVSTDAKQRSQQHYLSGVIFFQKGDYAKARDEWRLSRELDPANADAAAGLDRVAKLYGK